MAIGHSYFAQPLTAITVWYSMNTAIDYTRYYRKWHADTAEHIQGMKNYYRKILLKHLPPDKTIRILDVGCGMGFALLSLADMGYTKIEGIDADEGQVRSCVAKQLKVTHVNDSIDFLNRKKSAYDLILCLDVLEHIEYEAQLPFARALQWALTPGGKIICSVPNANSVLAGRWRYNDWTHRSSFTEHSIDFLLFNAGFDDIRIFSTEFHQAPPWQKLFSRWIFGLRFWKLIYHWSIFRFVRGFRRIEMIAELGWEEGAATPLSLNILATGTKASDRAVQREDEIDYTRIYKRWHSDSQEHINAMKNYYRQALSNFLPSDKRIRVLDVGCGMGFTILSLQEMGYADVEGIDTDYGQVQSCLRKQLNVTHVNDTIRFLHEKKDAYDLILCLDVLEHIAYVTQMQFARALQSSLKPGGKLICRVPNANSALAGRWRYIDWTHRGSFTEHSVDFLLYNAGFGKIQIYETEFVRKPDWRRLFSTGVLRRSFWKSVFFWSIFRFVRAFQRAKMVSELGKEEGTQIPLSLNIMVQAVKI